MTNQSRLSTNTKSPAWIVGLFCLLLLVSACTRTENPDDVTIVFWTALIDYDLEKAAAYSIEGSAQFFDEKVRNASLQVGKTHYDCDGATVETEIIRQSAAASSSFKTYLVMDEDEQQWKVDYRRTLKAIDQVSDKRFKHIKETGKTVKVSSWTFLKELGQAIATVFKEMKRRLLS